jgi:hypothetical protein
MKPVIVTPERLANSRFTSKVRKPRNINLITGLSVMHDPLVNALDYLETGNKLSTSTGTMLDAWGEKYATARGKLNDDQYRKVMQLQGSGLRVALQSRPAIGSYIVKTLGVTWLPPGKITVIGGAVGAVMNRAPLGRMIYAQYGGAAPLLALPDALVSATFSGTAYSAATPPNATLTNNAAMMPGNVFAAVWGGLNYIKTARAIRVKAGMTIRVKSGYSVLTREVTDEVISTDPVAPFNTLATARNIEVTTNG